MQTLTLTYDGTTINFLTTYKVLGNSFSQGIFENGAAEDTFSVWVDSNTDFTNLVQDLNKANEVAAIAREHKQFAFPSIAYRFDSDSGDKTADVFEIGLAGAPVWRGDSGRTKGLVDVYVVRGIFDGGAQSDSTTGGLDSWASYDGAGVETYFDIDLTGSDVDVPLNTLRYTFRSSGNPLYAIVPANFTAPDFDIQTDLPCLLISTLVRNSSSDLPTVPNFGDSSNASWSNDYTVELSGAEIEKWLGNWTAWVGVEAPGDCYRVRVKHGFNNSDYEYVGDWVTVPGDTDGARIAINLGNISIPVHYSETDRVYADGDTLFQGTSYYITVEGDAISTCTGATVGNLMLMPSDFSTLFVDRFGWSREDVADTTIYNTNSVEIDSENQDFIPWHDSNTVATRPAGSKVVGKFPVLYPNKVTRIYVMLMWYDASTGFYVLEDSSAGTGHSYVYTERHKYAR